jgi:hypothetical protein
MAHLGGGAIVLGQAGHAGPDCQLIKGEGADLGVQVARVHPVPLLSHVHAAHREQPPSYRYHRLNLRLQPIKTHQSYTHLLHFWVYGFCIYWGFSSVPAIL